MGSIRNILFATAITLFGPSTVLQAQVSLGYRVGVGIFHVQLPSDSGTAVLGPAIAIPIEVPINTHFAIQPEIGYAMKGLKEEGGGGVHYETRFNYGDIALLGKYTYGNDRLRLEAFAGPGLGYLFSVRGIRTVDAYESSNIDQVDRGSATRMHRFDPSLVGGAGVELACGVPHFFFNYRYVFGLSRLFELQPYGAVMPEAYNRGHVVSLGILIPIGRDAWADHSADN